MKKLFTTILLLQTFSIVSQQKNRFDKIDSLLVYLNQNDKFMGQISIREAGNIVFNKAYGSADFAKQMPANIDTKYKVGSITKTFTAVMIMQLIDENKLKLTTKLSKFYPKIINADKITIHDLLHHRTGIIDFLNGDKTTDVYANVAKEEMLARIYAYESLFEPNSKFEYSNTNYYILGCIIEDLSKKTYANNLQDRILNKIELKNTAVSDNSKTRDNEAFSYKYKDKNWTLNKEWNMSQSFGSGDLLSTTSDLTLFFEALFSGKLLKKSSLDEMTKLEQSYGKGLKTFLFGQRKFFGHTGGIEGFRAVTGYYPSEKTGIALITNADNYNQNDIIMGILSIYYKMPYQFPNLTVFEVKTAILQQYEGTYASKEAPFKMVLKVENNELVAKVIGQKSFALKAISETEFVFDVAGLKITFAGNKMVLNQGQGKYNFTKE